MEIAIRIIGAGVLGLIGLVLLAISLFGNGGSDIPGSGPDPGVTLGGVVLLGAAVGVLFIH